MLILTMRCKRVFRAVLISCTLIMLVSCSSFPKDDISFESMLAPEANIPEYKTFAWIASETELYDPQGYWQASGLNAKAEIIDAVNKGLDKSGFVEVRQNPDFVVLYSAGINMQWLEFKKEPITGKKVVTHIPKAALSIVFIDVKTELPIWLGSAQATLHKDMPVEIAKKRIHYAVQGILKTLPSAN